MSTEDDRGLQLTVGRDMRNKSYPSITEMILNAELLRIVMMIDIMLQVQHGRSPQYGLCRDDRSPVGGL
jgi:hypothetical protein